MTLLSGPLFFCECRGVAISAPQAVSSEGCCANQCEHDPQQDPKDDCGSCGHLLHWDFNSPEKLDPNTKNLASNLILLPDLAALHYESWQRQYGDLQRFVRYGHTADYYPGQPLLFLFQQVFLI